VESLWTLLADVGLPQAAMPSTPRAMAVHDPCGTRGEGEIQDAVRRILTGLGVQVEELSHARELTTCCGYGGLQSFANPEVADKAVSRRIAESEADYVTYCAMCRDNFSAKGKRSLHVLDLVFGSEAGAEAGAEVGAGAGAQAGARNGPRNGPRNGAQGAAEADPAARRGPTFSQRHDNRARLKARLLRELWGERTAGEGAPMNLIVSPEVQALMEKRMILAEDVEGVIAHAEASGDKIEDRATGHFIASHRPVNVTYWVEYSVDASGFVIHNTYSHRMEVG